MNCPHCGQPAAKLLEQLPGEGDAEYATRLRREWKRETGGGRRRRPGGESEEQLIEETYAILGVR